MDACWFIAQFVVQKGLSCSATQSPGFVLPGRRYVQSELRYVDRVCVPMGDDPIKKEPFTFFIGSSKVITHRCVPSCVDFRNLLMDGWMDG